MFQLYNKHFFSFFVVVTAFICSLLAYYYQKFTHVCIAFLKVAPAQCAAHHTVMQKWRRSPDKSVRGSRPFMQKPSPNQPVYTDMAQEISHRPFWVFFFKKPLFPIAIHTKTRMLFGQHFDGEAPRNLNHVFLRPFEHGFNKKKLGRLCSKTKMTEPP